MAKKASKVKKVSKVKEQSFFSQIKWGESYTSLFLGAAVVIVSLILFFSFIKSKTSMNQQTTSTAANTSIDKKTPKTYTVKKGDDLWNIAKNLYGSGYNWVDLAKANNLVNPGILYVGTKLNIPSVKPILVENNSSTRENVVPEIKTDKYTVVKGDNLWNIAVRAYGDGYKWVNIAKANQLVNPGLIHAGNVLSIPR